MIHLILGNDSEAKEYIKDFPSLDDVRIIHNVRQIEGLPGPFVLHFMPSWDEISFEERTWIVDYINRATIRSQR